ncbi:MAG: PSD1 domain-containing protein [Planctomycetaceae bacterium]|nr:PSD1 domain-containing protein [Planctomycetaceae bacterium]
MKHSILVGTLCVPSAIRLVGRAHRVCLLLFMGSSLSADEIRFNEHVRPILAEHCLHCHGPDDGHREGELRLDTEDAAKASVIVAGDPDKSTFMHRITSQDPDERMPPVESGKTLSSQQIELLRQWIKAGAPYQGHWAFEPIVKPELPTTQTKATSEIDRFVVARLEAQGLKLSAKVTRQQLIRRATFDLIGLPPTWEEVESFIADDTPDAFAKLIDRLLDSPRYGERWGRHWLDIARYADTHGGSAIGFKKFPFSYTYRDYVIKALNADVPYDRFVTEQLAADQLGLDENHPALAGLGFLTVGMQFRNRHDVIDDQIDVVTRGLMGLTVACARCHDHKYDPIPTTDYYALYATLASSTEPDMLPIVGRPPDSDAYRQYQRELVQLQTIHRDMARDQTEVMRGRLRMQVGLYLRELAKGTPEQDLSAAFLSYRTDDLRPLVLNRWRDYLAEMPADDPVFGPWLQLAALPEEDFTTRCSALVEAWKKENGDPAKFANLQNLSAAAPKWNPRVLNALTQKQPASLLDVADAYGNLFADVQRQWMASLLEASLEGAAGAEIITDQDARHEAINSAVNSQLRRHLHEPGTPTAMPDDLAMTLLNRTVRDNLGGKNGAIHNLQLSSPGSPPRAMVLEERIPEQPFHVFRRGNPIDRGEVVQAHFLTALNPSTSEPSTFPDGQRRLALARSIVDPSNPLLRRVLVNWVWQHHFGKGLVNTPDDFGARSQPPTHPLLLDYLAVSFQEDGWSLKKLHKRIMLSDVYQQAAIENADSREKDPGNHLLWRMPRRRMEMETMRDSTLAVSGELNVSTIGGRPFDFLSAPVVPRRSVYGFVNRDIISSLASTFDGANAASCTAKRSETTVPQQTLFALNSVFIQDRAAAFSKSCANIEDAEQRVRFMYRQAYSREPQDEELETAMQFVSNQANEEAGDRWQQLAHVLLASNEFVFVD